MKKSKKSKVYETYDEIIDWIDKNRRKDLSLERSYINLIQNHYPPGSSVLDIGCGTGEPIGKFFIKSGYKYTGVDASEKMIELCKIRFPYENWIVEDMRSLELDEQYDIVIAWHSFFHLPPDDQRKTLKKLTQFVKPSGLLVFTSGPEEGESWGENGGYELYHASLSTEEYESILNKNHLEVLTHNVQDPNCGGATVWLAQKKE